MNHITYAITALVLSIALPVSAYTGITTDTEGSAGVNAGVSGGVNVNVGASATTSNSSQTSSGSDADADTTAETTASSDIVVGVPGNVEVIVVTRGDVDGDGAISASASPATVTTDADLSGFVAAQVAADQNVSKVESSSSRVSVTYAQKAKLFGFIPVTVNATATVEADGSVDVRYPWYAFLMVTNEAELETAIEGEISSLPSVNASANAGLELTANAQAELIDEVRAAMETQLALDAGGTVGL